MTNNNIYDKVVFYFPRKKLSKFDKIERKKYSSQLPFPQSMQILLGVPKNSKNFEI